MLIVNIQITLFAFFLVFIGGMAILLFTNSADKVDLSDVLGVFRISAVCSAAIFVLLILTAALHSLQETLL